MSQPVCPACGQNAFQPLEYIDVSEQHRWYAPNNQEMQRELTTAASESALAYQMLKCMHCDLEFSDPMRAPSAAWYHFAYRSLALYPEVRWEFDEVLQHVAKGDRLFEFGCGSGSFLLRCQEHGLLASGIDFSKDGVADCMAKGLAAKQVDLNEIASATDADRFPQMAAFHFLEHLDKPATLFKQAASRALPSAGLWVSVPGDLRPSRYFGDRDFLDQPPHHMTRWTSEAFREIGMRHGWRLAHVLYEPIPIKTALWSISIYSPAYRGWKNAGRFKSPIVERSFRALASPVALLRRLTIDRSITGFAMLAHFVFDGRCEGSAAPEVRMVTSPAHPEIPAQDPPLT